MFVATRVTVEVYEETIYLDVKDERYAMRVFTEGGGYVARRRRSETTGLAVCGLRTVKDLAEGLEGEG